jgi:hypothetical protein
MEPRVSFLRDRELRSVPLRIMAQAKIAGTIRSVLERMAKHSLNSIFGEEVSMKKNIFGIVALAMICCFLSGCGRRVEDVTSSPKYNFSKFAGTVWKTKVKAAVADLKGAGPEPKTYLLAPKAFDPNHPEYIPPSGGMEIIEVLPVGTRLRLEQLQMKKTFETTYIWVTASLEDGRVVRLSDRFLAEVDFRWVDTEDWGVNPDMLEKAE